VEYLIPLLIIAVLILINGFFVAAEFAVAAASRPRVAQLAASGSSSARRVLKILSDPLEINRYLSTAQIGITLASLGLGMYGEHAVAEWLVGPLEHLGWFGVTTAHTIAIILSVGVLTYLHVVIGEMIPKAFALQAAGETAIRLSPAMAFTEAIFRPLTSVLNWIGNGLLRLLGVPPANPAARLVSSDELAYILEESSEGGLLDPTEQIFLENVIDFQQRNVSQVMTPRTRMVAIPLDADLDQVLAMIQEDRHSRYPVYEEDRDHIVGILYVKDFARRLLGGANAFKLSSLVRPSVYVPETLPLDDMLAQFRNAHFQIAVVLDEYGGTAGIVTLEDLAEEIIGEIQDEFDEEIAPFEELNSSTLRVRGDLLLDELTQHYDLDFEAEEAETIGGLIMSMLGHVAQPGEAVEYHGLHLEVESMDGLAVNTVIVTLPQVTPAAPLNGDTTESPPATETPTTH
jgi:CBS domain containing-hemolysin-like protein